MSGQNDQRQAIPENPQDNITKVVRILMAWRGMHQQKDLATVLDVDDTAITKAFKGARKWKIDDVATMARFFDVSVAVFFDDPETLIRSRWGSHRPTSGRRHDDHADFQPQGIPELALAR